MKIRYATLIYVIIAMTALMATAIKWAPVDNEHFAAISPGAAYYTPILPYKLRYPLVLLVALIVIAKPQSLRLFVYPLVAVVLLAFLSTIWSIQPRESFVSAVELALYVSVPALAAFVVGPTKMIRTIWGVGTAVLIASMALALAGSEYGLMAGVHEGAWRGLFNHKNVFGPFSSSMFLLTIFGQGILKLNRLVRWAVILSAAVCLVMSSSTTALAACVIGLLFGLLVSMPIRDRTIRIGSYAALAIFLVPTGLLAMHFAGAAAGVFGKDLTFSGRSEIWKGAMEAALMRPLGYGFETSGGDLVLELIKQSSGFSKVASMHSAYLKIWIDLGVVGLLLVAGWFILLLFSSFTTTVTRWAPLMVAVLLNHITMGTMEVAGGVSPSYSLFLLVAVATSVKFYELTDRSAKMAKQEVVGAIPQPR